MHPLRRIAQRQLGRLAHHEIAALPYLVGPVGAFDLVADHLENLVERDHEEQEKGNVRHTPHDGDIALAEPRQRPDARPRRHRAAKPEGKCRGRGDRQKQQHRAHRDVEIGMLYRG
jgi:hypothetical protein